MDRNAIRDGCRGSGHNGSAVRIPADSGGVVLDDTPTARDGKGRTNDDHAAKDCGKGADDGESSPPGTAKTNRYDAIPARPPNRPHRGDTFKRSTVPLTHCKVCRFPIYYPNQYHCKPCYGCIYKRIQDVSTFLAKAGRRFDVAGDDSAVLSRLETWLTELDGERRCPEGKRLMCSPAKYHFTTAKHERCPKYVAAGC